MPEMFVAGITNKNKPKFSLNPSFRVDLKN